MLLAACGAAKSCANGCEHNLTGSAGEGLDDEQRERVLMKCFPAFKAAHASDATLTGEAWFMRYLERGVLDPVEARQLDAARVTLGLDKLD